MTKVLLFRIGEQRIYGVDIDGRRGDTFTHVVPFPSLSIGRLGKRLFTHDGNGFTDNR